MKQRSFTFFIVTITLSVFSLASLKNDGDESKMEFKIFSNAFKEGELIPSKFTCDGENISPQLSWIDTPAGTKSLALINDDPDAPVGDWVHWIVFNIPANVKELTEDASKKKQLPQNVLEGKNDFGKLTYGGPCPPSGTHRYFFKLYALDKNLQLNAGVTKKQLLEAMKGHILATAQLIGKYKRK